MRFTKIKYQIILLSIAYRKNTKLGRIRHLLGYLVTIGEIEGITKRQARSTLPECTTSI